MDEENANICEAQVIQCLRKCNPDYDRDKEMIAELVKAYALLSIAKHFCLGGQDA